MRVPMGSSFHSVSAFLKCIPKARRLFGHKKARTTADAFSGIRVRNELRTGVILAEDINILKNKKCQYITGLTAQLYY